MSLTCQVAYSDGTQYTEPDLSAYSDYSNTLFHSSLVPSHNDGLTSTLDLSDNTTTTTPFMTGYITIFHDINIPNTTLSYKETLGLGSSAWDTSTGSNSTREAILIVNRILNTGPHNYVVQALRLFNASDIILTSDEIFNTALTVHYGDGDPSKYSVIKANVYIDNNDHYVSIDGNALFVPFTSGHITTMRDLSFYAEFLVFDSALLVTRTTNTGSGTLTNPLHQYFICKGFINFNRP